MIVVNYNQKHHKTLIHAAAEALRQGKVVAYPTDTCYGLAVDTENIKAVKLLYKVKGRSFKKPIAIIPPSLANAKRLVKWNRTAEKLAKKFLPGPLTLILGLKVKTLNLTRISAGKRELGIRLPKNKIALDLAKALKRPITTTSANLAGLLECYSLSDLQKQFGKAQYKPDIIINAGKLKHQRPSTLIKINQDQSIQILRPGPISETQINKIINQKS